MKKICCYGCGKELIRLEPYKEGMYEFWCDDCNINITIKENSETKEDRRSKMLMKVLDIDLLEEILTNPYEYVNNSQDIVLAEIYEDEEIDNPIYIMIGSDEYEDYYLVVEDNDTSEDIYPEDEETLLELYIRLLEEIAQ